MTKNKKVEPVKPEPKKEWREPQITTVKKGDNTLTLSEAEIVGLREQISDLTTERDALAKRVMELEEQPLKELHTPPPPPPPPAPVVIVAAGADVQKARIAELEAFLIDALKTATWNSSTAAELLKK